MIARRFGVITLCFASLLGLTGAGFYNAGVRVNFTDSAPHGFWRVRTINVADVKRGELVEVCPPPQPIVRLMGERGYLEPGNCADSSVAPFLKPVAATEGDSVLIEKGQPVVVNGVALPNTSAMPAVPSWPTGLYVVKPGEVWLFSSYSAGSFDSRYFGPVSASNIRGRALPLLVKGDVAAMTNGVISSD